METAFATRKDEQPKVAAPARSVPEGRGPEPDERGVTEGMPLFLQRASTSSTPPLDGHALVQTKLIVGQPDDEFEREADRVAKVATTTSPSRDETVSNGLHSMGENRIQRSCAGCDEGHPCAECEEERATAPGAAEEHVQRKTLPPSSSGTATPISGTGTVGDSGSPLSRDVRDRVEPVLGVSLDHVRVHNSVSAGVAAQTLRAKAFTHRDHIWLGANQDPNDTELMAHEATHVVQQTSGAAPVEAIQRQAVDTQRTDDGAEVRRRMQQHIDEALGRPEREAESSGPASGTPAAASPTAGAPTPGGAAAANPEAGQAARSVDRAELASKKGELQPQAHPSVDRAAEEQPRVEQAAGVTKEEVDKPPDLNAQLSGPGAQDGGGGGPGQNAAPDGTAGQAGAAGPGPEAAPGGKTAGDKAAGQKAAGDEAAAAAAQAAGMADQAFSLADSQPVPEAPSLLLPPAPAEPVDAKGMPLAGNPGADMQLLDLADRAQALREGGHRLQAQASEGRTNAQILQGNMGLVQQGIAQAEGGVHTSQDHLTFRRSVVTQAQQALTVSEQKAANVAEQAPNYVTKSAEGKAKSGPLASEAGQMSAENRANTPDDEEAAARAQEQGGKINQVSSDATTTDDAITQAQTASGTLVQDAARAKQVNTETRGKVDTIQQTLGQTDQRLNQMQGQNAEARAQLDGMMDQPAAMTAQAGELDAEGQALIQASVDMETDLQQTQRSYTDGMQTVPGVEMPTEGAAPAGPDTVVQRQPVDAAAAAPLAAPVPAADGAPDAGVSADGVPADASTLATVAPAPVAGPAPEATPQPSSINIASGVPSWLTGEPEVNAEERLKRQQQEEKRRADQIAEITARADGHFERLSAGDKMDIALRMTGRNLFGGISNISWPGWGGIAKGAGHLAAGLIDPRAPLMGVVSGLNMVINGVANFARRPSWGGALKMAADIATGLTIILGSITALAGVIIAIMTAITILSLGTAAPITGPVIAFCATVMSTVGGWTLWVGAIALLLQELVFLKNLYEAATAQTAEQLQQQSDNMTEDARNAGNVVMQMGMAKLSQVGGRNMQSAIQVEGGGVRFAARMGAEGLPNRVAVGVRQAGGVRAYAGQVASSARSGVAAAGGVGRFAVQSTVSGARGVGGFVRRTARELTGEAPAGLPGAQGFSRDFLVGKDIPGGSYFSSARSVTSARIGLVEAEMAPRLGPAAAGEVPPAPRPAEAVPAEAPPAQPAAPPAEVAAPANPSEVEMLQNTTTKTGAQLSRQELNGELDMVKRAEPTPIHEGPYVEKVELKNGHEWRQTEDGTWCRFSPGPPDCFGIGSAGPTAVEAPPKGTPATPTETPKPEAPPLNELPKSEAPPTTVEPPVTATAPKPTRAPLPDDLVPGATSKRTIDLTGEWEAPKLKPDDGVIYVLRDQDTGQLLKVGKSEGATMEASRLYPYDRAGRFTGRKLELEVYVVPDKPGVSFESIEKGVRDKLVTEGNALPWDQGSSSARRLGRPGPGVPGTRLPSRLRKLGYRWQGEDLVDQQGTKVKL